MNEVPRPEYPRPQFIRADWLCLNGKWQFEIDLTDTGIANGWIGRDLAGEIIVPFCPESELSGVHRTEFLHAVWYRRKVSIPAAWVGRQVLLHFQACDYDTTVWIDGTEAVRHRGGYTPFTADLGVAPERGPGCHGRVACTRSTQSTDAAGQAVNSPGKLRLSLHAYDGYLADGVAGACAAGAFPATAHHTGSGVGDVHAGTADQPE